MSSLPELTGAQKRALKSRAQLLEPVLRLGQSGLTEAFLRGLDEALELHTLVKVAEFKEEKKTLALKMSEGTASTLIQVVGNVAVFYRPKASLGKA